MRNEIESCIQKFISEEFQKYPRDFIKEEDTRAVLFTRLKDCLKENRRKIQPEKLPLYQNENEFDMDLVKCEYSYENYQGKACNAFDIAVLHKEENIWIGKDNWEKYHHPKSRKAQMYWNQPVRFGLEIKSVWHNWEADKRITGVKSDSKKLQDYLKSNYCSQNFKDENGDPFQFEGAALLFASNEIYHARFIESQVEVGKNCFAYCITPTKIYRIQ